MWYVMQVKTGTEENIKLQCERVIPDCVLERCFLPYYEERRHVQGEWRTFRRILFPGYVFVVTDELEKLYPCLRNVQGLTKMLGADKEVIPLSAQEISFLRRMGGEEQLVEMSEGIIEGGMVRITAGPLIGMEGLIKRIDRHKRKAWLEMGMFGRKQTVQVGLEIVEKR